MRKIAYYAYPCDEMTTGEIESELKVLVNSYAAYPLADIEWHADEFDSQDEAKEFLKQVGQPRWSCHAARYKVVEEVEETYREREPASAPEPVEEPAPEAAPEGSEAEGAPEGTVSEAVPVDAGALSSPQLEILRQRLKEAEDKLAAFDEQLFCKDFKVATVGCKTCNSIINRLYFKTNYCPVCGADMRSETLKKQREGYQSKVDRAKGLVEAEEKKLKKRAEKAGLADGAVEAASKQTAAPRVQPATPAMVWVTKVRKKQVTKKVWLIKIEYRMAD